MHVITHEFQAFINCDVYFIKIPALNQDSPKSNNAKVSAFMVQDGLHVHHICLKSNIDMSSDKIPNCKLDHTQTHIQQRYIKILHHHCYPEVPLLLHAPMHICAAQY